MSDRVGTMKFGTEGLSVQDMSRVIKKGLALGLSLVDTWVEKGSGWFAQDKVFLKFEGREYAMREFKSFLETAT